MRTSARCVREEPTRSNSPLSMMRSSFACCPTGTLPISSMNSVPPIRELEAADAVGLRIRERAAHVAHHLALEHASPECCPCSPR